MKKITEKEKKLILLTLAGWGIILIGSGTIMTINTKPLVKKNLQLRISQKKVSESKTNEIKLKDMELEVNQPLSVNVKDYLENIEEISNSVLKSLKLDTSMVNINQPGTYTYTISYKKKKYNGTFTIKEKELPKVEITLKNLTLEKGSALSTNLSTYIVEELTDEVKNHITLNLTNVNTSQAGNYQYSVTYNGKLYTATITIYEPQPTILTPNNKEEEKENNNPEKTPDSKTPSPTQ